MITIVIGYIADVIFGDPRCLPHPVRLIGKSINWIEGLLRKRNCNTFSEKWRGVFLTAIIVTSAYILTFYLLKLANYFSEYLGYLVEAFLIYQILALKSLDYESRKVLIELRNGDMKNARKALSYIVGRDTTTLNDKEVTRATVETIAENISDGIIAPLFFTFIGGIPLGMAYKAINTLDSMVGYKNDRYIHFGWASAKLDDLVNFIPARLTGILIVIASLWMGYNWRNSISILKRDCRNHSSPNSGYPEAAMAGALEIQIGGTNSYFGQLVYKPTIGEPIKKLHIENIAQTIRIMYSASTIGLALFISFYLLVNK